MRRALRLSLLLAVMSLLAACGSGDEAPPAVTKQPAISSATPKQPVRSKGPTIAASPPSSAEPATATATVEPDPTSPSDDPETATPASPFEGTWIDVDVTNFRVRLMDGEAVVREIAPVAIGAQIDTGAYLSTQTGLFHVYSKVEDLVFDAPFDTYISHWVGFDPERDNGFHSFLKDDMGAVVDASTGRVSNGCIRTGAPEAIFAFAEIGMPVLVHT